MPLNAVKLQISRAGDMVCVYKRKNLGGSPSARHVTIPYFPDWILRKKKKKKPNNFIIFCQVEVSHTELPESHDDSFVLSL